MEWQRTLDAVTESVLRGRSEFKVGTMWFRRHTATCQILNGSPKEHKGVRDEK